ncbi:hydrogenase subunit MbhD domain-containing protein [Xylanimonas sp. McL0601]|uniref:hydrogenase subunit MbhD domain-containing protein n=1 Tax=Xylanimonas sp. McL0601 TaxID=3414739 RepID=UPI003CF4105D
MGIDQIVFVLLIVFALAAVFASCLKHAIITSGVFGLWASLAYLLHHAPDVAISEAVVASSLGTVLLILTIRNYGDIKVPGIPRMIWQRKGADLVMLGTTALVLFLTVSTPQVEIGPVRDAVMGNFLDSSGVVNPVTSVLLHYRVFDTVLEALMLLVAVLGVMHLSDAKIGGPAAAGYGSLSARHPTMVKALQILTPVLIIVGVALIVGDPITPGGGFQGAGLLAAVIVSRYLAGARGPAGTKNLETLEKVIFVVFVLSVGLYVFLGLREYGPDVYAPFMIAMNGLLGLKVFCGLSIMFLYFTREA